MPTTTQTTVNTTGATDQSGPVTVATPDGGFVVVWYDDADGNNSSLSVVRAQQFDADGNKIGDEVHVGTSEVEGYDVYDMPPLTASLLSDGNVIIGWQADGSADVEGNGTTAVVGSVFDTTSQTASSEFQINTYENTNQSGPEIVSLEGGGFVAVWYDNASGNDSSTMVVRAQQFDNSGNLVGSEVQVGSSEVEGYDIFDMPPLTAVELSDGNVMIGWQSDGSAYVEGNSTSAVVGSVFDTSSQSASSEFQMNTYEDTHQSAPEIVSLEGGGFVAVWYDNASANDSSTMLVRAQQFDNSGNPVGSEVQVGSSEVEGYDHFDMPPLTAVELSDGNVMVGWLADGTAYVEGNSSGAVVGSVFDTTSQSAGSEFQINPSTTSHESAPILVSMGNGTFVAVWYEDAYLSGAGNVFAQQFSNDGTAIGSPTQIGTATVDGTSAYDMPPVSAVLVGGNQIQISWQADHSENADSDTHTTAVVTSTFIPSVICFCAGTMIDTPGGPVPVEDLRAGDMLLTRDHGAQPISWIGQRKLDPQRGLKPSQLPILITAGALGKGVPNADLWVSPQHRFVVRSKIVPRMFDCEEVLVAARHLSELDGISVDTGTQPFTYFHILMEQHEVVFANAARAETLLLADMTLNSLSKSQQAEIAAAHTGTPQAPAAPIAQGQRAKTLIQRHAQNAKPVFTDQIPPSKAEPLRASPLTARTGNETYKLGPPSVQVGQRKTVPAGPPWPQTVCAQ